MLEPAPRTPAGQALWRWGWQRGFVSGLIWGFALGLLSYFVGGKLGELRTRAGEERARAAGAPR